MTDSSSSVGFTTVFSDLDWPSSHPLSTWLTPQHGHVLWCTHALVLLCFPAAWAAFQGSAKWSSSLHPLSSHSLLGTQPLLMCFCSSHFLCWSSPPNWLGSALSARSSCSCRRGWGRESLMFISIQVDAVKE